MYFQELCVNNVNVLYSMSLKTMRTIINIGSASLEGQKNFVKPTSLGNFVACNTLPATKLPAAKLPSGCCKLPVACTEKKC